RVELGRGILALGLAGALALGLSGFYWLPALSDRRFVHFEHNTTGYFNFHNHFLSLGRLVQTSLIYDYALDGTPDGSLPFQLGLLQVVAAVLGLLVCAALARRLPREALLLVAVGAAVGLGYAAVATPLTLPLWERVEPLQIAQFPWRVLGPASVGLALVAA